MASLDENKRREIETAEASKGDPNSHRKPFGPQWGHAYWGKWQTLVYMLGALGIPEGGKILDVGVGGGWTTLFLAEAGYDAMGIELAPSSVQIATNRAARKGVGARFAAADMDVMDLGETFDAVVFFDALHHTARQTEVIRRAALHVAPDGWLIFGEPSWLHNISPGARRTHRETGWIERGIRVNRLKQDCALAGFATFRRFYEGTAPHSTVTQTAYQVARLIGARVTGAPQMSVWIGASRR